MFDKPYRFHGSHAKKVRELTSIFDGDSKAQFFRFAKETYAFAPLVGFLYNRRADLDHLKNPETSEEYDVNVMAEQVLSVNEDLTFHFCLIMLLDSAYEQDEDKRIDKAFRYVGKDPADEARFDEYVRGGVDVLHEKLIEGPGDPESYVSRLFDFVEDIQERYNAGVDTNALMKICISER